MLKAKVEASNTNAAFQETNNWALSTGKVLELTSVRSS